MLGPLLFLLYINDPPLLARSSCRLFADDCVTYRRIKTADDTKILQEDLDRFQEWERLWLMSFHPDKCQLVRVTNKRKPVQGSYTIHGQVLEQVNSAKYLGVNISKTLSWNEHVHKISRKADNTRAFIQKNMRHCPREVKAACYTTLVRPTLEYASCTWSPHTAANITKLEQVQRRSARFVMGDYSWHNSVTPMLQTLGWESLEARRSKAQVTMLYRIVNNHIDIPSSGYITPLVTTSRGHSCRLFQPYCRTLTYQRSFFPTAINKWNQLPESLVSIPTLEGFKAGLASHRLV